MNKVNEQTAALLKEAFGAMGVVAEDGLATLAEFYFAKAVSVATLEVIAFVAAAWALGKVSKTRWWTYDAWADDGDDKIHALIAAVITVACVMVIVGVWVEFPTTLAAAVSPEGYALDKIVGEVAK